MLLNTNILKEGYCSIFNSGEAKRMQCSSSFLGGWGCNMSRKVMNSSPHTNDGPKLSGYWWEPPTKHVRTIHRIFFLISPRLLCCFSFCVCFLCSLSLSLALFPSLSVFGDECQTRYFTILVSHSAVSSQQVTSFEGSADELWFVACAKGPISSGSGGPWAHQNVYLRRMKKRNQCLVDSAKSLRLRWIEKELPVEERPVLSSSTSILVNAFTKMSFLWGLPGAVPTKMNK